MACLSFYRERFNGLVIIAMTGYNLKREPGDGWRE